MDWKDSNKVKEYFKSYRQAHKEEAKAWYKEHKEEFLAKQKEYDKAHKEERNSYIKEYIQSDLNDNGETKHSIRIKSNAILKQMNLHIPGYQIHHCFGYEDPSKFIYISRALHLKIHQLLRDKNIDASNDHWMAIRDIVNSADEFMYIKC